MLDLGIFSQDTPDGDTTWGLSLLSGFKYTLILVALAWIVETQTPGATAYVASSCPSSCWSSSATSLADGRSAARMASMRASSGCSTSGTFTVVFGGLGGL